jgi:acetyl esterase/lipase
MGTERFKKIVRCVCIIKYRLLNLLIAYIKIRVDIQYSKQSTNCKLDVYLPDKKDTPAPIIVFIYGGSWSSGSKLLYTTCANTLRQFGYVVVVPDYRKYPEVKIDSIYHDIREAIKWTFAHSDEIGGDSEAIYILVVVI